VQHISTFMRLFDSKDWIYTFTQEWPAPSQKNQLSYTLAFQQSHGFPGSSAGIGDTLFNYRYQLVGSGDSLVAFAPRVSALFPTGNAADGRSIGGFGLQTNLPLSVVVTPKLVTHWNAGATIVPRAEDAAGDHARAVGYNLGQSFIFLAHHRFNAMFETVFNSAQSVTGPNHTQWTNSLYLNPGIRWSYNFKSGLQIVPGIAVPIGVGPSAGDQGVLLYLSFEHPFRKLKGNSALQATAAHPGN